MRRVGVPFVGFLLDKRTTLDASLVVMGCGIAYGVLSMTSHAAPQTIAIGIFVFLRPLMYTFGEWFVVSDRSSSEVG